MKPNGYSKHLQQTHVKNMKCVQRVQMISNLDQILIEMIMVKTYYKPKTIIAVVINGGILLLQT